MEHRINSGPPKSTSEPGPLQAGSQLTFAASMVDNLENYGSRRDEGGLL